MEQGKEREIEEEREGWSEVERGIYREREMERGREGERVMERGRMSERGGARDREDSGRERERKRETRLVRFRGKERHKN